MGILQVVCYATQPGIRADDDSTAAGKLTREMHELALAQPGARAAYWAHEVENPTHLWSFLQWDLAEDHITWNQHPEFKSFTTKLQSMLDHDRGHFSKHAQMSPLPVAALDADKVGVTEVLTAYFPADISPDDQAEISRVFQDFLDKGLEGYSDFRGASVGWGVDKDFPLPLAAGAGGVGNNASSAIPGTAGYAVHWVFIGWPSVEAHMKYRETDRFRDNIGALRGLPRLVQLAAVHVSCRMILRTAE